MSKTVLFQTIRFSISTLLSSIWPIDRTLSGATTLGQSGSESDGNKEVLCIPQSSSITGASSSFSVIFRTLVSGWGVGLYLSAEMQTVYSAAPPNFYWLKLKLHYFEEILLSSKKSKSSLVVSLSVLPGIWCGCYMIQYYICDNFSVFCKNLYLKTNNI